MKKKKRKQEKTRFTPRRNLDLSEGDLDAIWWAIPFLDIPELTESNFEVLDDLNKAAYQSLDQKMAEGGKIGFTADEMLVIGDALHSALEYLKGERQELEQYVDAEWKSELVKHFFNYNRLVPIFDRVADELEELAIRHASRMVEYGDETGSVEVYYDKDGTVIYMKKGNLPPEDE